MPAKASITRTRQVNLFDLDSYEGTKGQMISTVTTATVSTIMTAPAAVSFALVGILVLFVLLVQKELASASPDLLLKRLSRVVDVAVFPLLFAFVMIAIFKVADVLR